MALEKEFEGLPEPEKFDDRLTRELSRVNKSKHSAPAIVLCSCKPEAEVDVQKALYEISADPSQNFAVNGMEKQGLDWVSWCEYKGKRYTGIILEHANGYVDQVKDKILAEVRRRLNSPEDSYLFTHIGFSSYEAKTCETLEQMVKVAAKEK